MVFVFDLDDTMSATDEYSEKYIKNFIINHKLPYKQIAKDVRFAEAKFDWTSKQANDWYKKYGDQMMLEFPVKSGVKKLINTIHKNGHKIIVCTARANDWHTEPEKITKLWFEKNKIFYDKIYIGVYDKETVCAQENADVFIDDDLNILSKVHTKFEELGKKITCFMSTTNYNKNLDCPNGVIRIQKICDMLDYLKVKNDFIY